MANFVCVNTSLLLALWATSYCFMYINLICPVTCIFQILSKALIDCHTTSSEAGFPLKLKIFISGRNRLENPGAKSLAEAFQV